MRTLLQFCYGKPVVWTAACLGLCVLFAKSVRAEERMVLDGVRPAAAKVLTPVGRLPAAQQLHLAFALPLRNQGELTGLMRQLYDPASTNFHKFLTPPEFAARFGPTEADYATVINFAVTNGLTVTGTHPNRLLLDVAGRTADIERAFGIGLRTYRHPTEARDFFAPDADPTVPTNLPVADLCGLSDFALPRPQSHVIDSLKITPLNFDGSGPSGTYRGADFRHAYAPGSGLTGAGQTVAVAEFDGYYLKDITNYEAQCGYTNVPLTNVLMSGVTGNPSGNANHVGEVSLDIELAIAMAPGLSQVIVYEGKTNAADPYDVFNRIATDNLAKQISCSWGWYVPPRWYWKSPDHSTTLDSILSEMVVQGQAFFQASGDSDAYTGKNALSTTTGPIPVDSPYVTSCGGTTLTMAGTGSVWSAETGWNRGNNIGSGGGSSPNYLIPSWQTNVNASIAANGGSMINRNIPDVALTSDAVYVIYNNGSSGSFYGTSCAAPLWAGFCALANQQAVASGFVTNSIGFLNPALYAIAAGANYQSCFHDITTGNNIGTGTPGLFYAASGYDLCTGLGTPAGTNLINALAPPATVVGRWVFYNNSAWDGNNPAANANDDNAIATDKTALLPGGTASFANYTSYSRGLNGIMMDIANLLGTPTASDFVFNTGNDNNPAGWSNAPAPVSITVRAGAGAGGSSRVTLIWNDNNLNGVVDANEAVAKKWLEVTVKATTNTGLATDDVFFFGNAVGEGDVGNPNTSFPVTAADALQAMNNLIGLGTAALTNVNDFNRDQKVTSADALVALNNLSALSALVKLDLSSSSGSSMVAASMTASAPIEPFLGESLISPGIMRLWLWQSQQSNPALEMTENLGSGPWQPVPSDWLKPLGGGLFEVDVPVGAGSVFLRLQSNGTGAPGQ